MPNWSAGAGGALSGGAAGAAIGSAVPGIGTAIGAGGGALIGGLASLFGADNSMSDDDRARLIALYQGYLDKLPGGANADPRETDALNELKSQASGTGLTPDLMATILQQRMAADRMAQGRESAIQTREAEMGRGTSNSGQSAVMQAQGSQDAATRAQMAGMETAGLGAANKRAALAAYLGQLVRLDALRLQATGGLAGAVSNSQDYHGAAEAANNANVGSAINTAGNIGLYMANRPSGGAAPAVGYDPTAGGGKLAFGSADGAPAVASNRAPGYFDQTSPAPAFSAGQKPPAAPIDPSLAAYDPNRKPIIPQFDTSGY